ncbi:MAG: class I SAM-dependent methyltransferase [Flavobacteriaceae bacterium]|nr:class I SAM-dependent methyltransferase [Flavobacteriaceae bacterium]
MGHLKTQLGTTDIYLIDQILKSRYKPSDLILDAGCGSGRNLPWFYNNGFSIYGIDKDEKYIEDLKQKYNPIAENFSISTLESTPFKNDMFDHIICNAVLHFAENTSHFKTMFAELIRILKPNGSLFIRMTSNIGIENNVVQLSEGVYKLPDKTTRFLLTKTLLDTLVKNHYLSFLEPLKTVNVNDIRCMSTLILQKN